MKKTLVALASVVAVTGAMAEATITGSIQVGTNRTHTYTNGTTASNSLTLGDDNGNTALNFGVSEDLGSGLKAMGNIALDVGNASATSTALGSGSVGETYLGVSGGFGTIKAGALQTPQFLAVAAGDGGGGYLVANLVGTNNTRQGGTIGSLTLLQAQSVQYTLPTFMEGLSLKYQSALGSDIDMYGSNHYAADYKSGPLAVGVAYSTYKYGTTDATDKATTYYATYDFGPVTLKALMGKATFDGQGDVSSGSIGVAIPVGAFTIMYNHATSDSLVYNKANTAPAAADLRTVSNEGQAADFIGVSYAFSKRTTAYAVYYKETGNDSINAAAGTNFGSDKYWSTAKFIVIHSF